LEFGGKLFCNSPKERCGRSDFAFDLGGVWKLNARLNVLFTGGRDIVGDTRAMGVRRIAPSHKVNLTQRQSVHSYRNASIGSSLAAFRAG